MLSETPYDALPGLGARINPASFHMLKTRSNLNPISGISFMFFVSPACPNVTEVEFFGI